MVVGAWLADLARANGSEEGPPTDRGWLTESGFRNAVENGRVEKRTCHVNVYVESKFVLELVFVQEQAASCAEIVRLAEARELTLVIPAYSLLEPYETLVRRHRDRDMLAKGLEKVPAA